MTSLSLPRAVSAALFSVLLGGTSFAQEPIKIGWLSSLTGPLSSAAIAENQGVQFAVDEINKAGGINGRKIELLTRDTAGEPTKAVNLAQQLVFSDKVHVVIGPVNSGESLATVPILAKAGIPNIVIGALEGLIDEKKFPYAFRAINTNTQWIAGANNYALDVLKKKKVAVIGDTSGYGTASAKTATELLEKAGIKPVYSVLIDPNKTDVSDEMNKAKTAGADVVMPWTAATGLMARILNTRGNMGWDVPVVGHPAVMALPIKALLNKPEYWENTFAAGYQSTTYVDGKLPERTQKLVDALKPALGGKIDFTFWWVALGYDCVKIIEHVVKTTGGLEPAKFKATLEATKDFPGIYASYTWTPQDHNGFPDRNIVVNSANSFKDGSYDKAPH
ncbi:ABC transporter substrate-binding protein [Enterovirga rhinocerotis]|uniref:Amino acid/amide ABC transporter substrate-binding protein (HAAT family) n=1 Tax=Enterovirga rhinocerotis TaxID=1339210 RepID=A0A4V6PZE3_9HYPH|nr:ABC transporter substrate-binding protein [Enterovirga rhinocerotis]TDR85159.1 amino acid/amide ABC transporter substrate-binding protein (HAAT family) [Enterovirga rhinocerotis]